MATQPPPPANGPSGTNHVGLKIGDRSLSLQSQNLVLILFVIAVSVLAWFRSQTLATHLSQVQITQTQLLAAIQTGHATARETFQEELHTLRETLLTRQVAIQQASGEERTALSQALTAHVQQSQGQLQQCLDLVRQRLPGP